MSTDTQAAIRFGPVAGGWTVAQVAPLSFLPGLRHAISTCRGPHGGNLHAQHPGGLANRRGLALALGAEGCVWLNQVHGARVVEASEALDGPTKADALITDQPGVGLLGLSADCPIVLAADAVRGAVGMAHAGLARRSLLISAELVAALVARYGCQPADMQAVICPSAGPCCYEVRDDVLAAAMAGIGESAFRRSCSTAAAGRCTWIFWRANVEQLTSAGLCRHNIGVAGVCTICDRRFFSHRRQGPPAGRFGCLIIEDVTSCRRK